MNIQFCGGAQTVTGSNYLFTVNGKKILLECGLFQGRREEAYKKNSTFSYDPASIDALVLSHAHMDHSGNIPNLIRHGFKGDIYATPVTVELCKIMLRDSAYLQQKDIEWVNKIRAKQHKEPIEVLYSIIDVEETFDHFVPVEYEQSFTVAPGVTVTFKDAGHILGSAGVLFEIEEKGRRIELGFTGDLGRPDMPILCDPNVIRKLDVLMMECTYGNRTHGSMEDVEDELADTVTAVAAGGGKIIIPSFAVGRTQLMVYLLHKLFNQNRIPEIPIYVDSPMAVKATEVFRKHTETFDRETNRIFLDGDEDPFGFRRLKYIESPADSKKLNGVSYPHIIISASGMCEGGRILHHLRNGIHDRRNLILFVGYAAKHTLARKIMDGEKKINIFGEPFDVKAAVKVMDAFSAHADRRGLLDYIKMNPPEKLKHLFFVHGEPDQAASLMDAVRSMGYRGVRYPAVDEVVEI